MTDGYFDDPKMILQCINQGLAVSEHAKSKYSKFAKGLSKMAKQMAS